MVRIKHPPASLVVLVMSLSWVAGATGGFWVFTLSGPVKQDEIAVRICLGLVLLFTVAFGWTLYRVVNGLPPANVSMPDRLNPPTWFHLPPNETPWVTSILAFLIAYEVATTVFR